MIELMSDLRERGILLKAHGDRLRYSPRSSVTPELAQRMKAHKVALLAILTTDDIPAAVLWQAALDLLEGDPEFPPEMLVCCRRASARWESELPAGDCVNEPTEGEIDRDAPQCDRCGSIDYRDISIHNGQSARRDCGRCHRFLGWAKWYGRSGAEACRPNTCERRFSE